MLSRKTSTKLGARWRFTRNRGGGAVFIIKISLTLAIVSALIVRVGTEKFAIPQASITELVKAGTSRTQEISYIQGRPVLKLRESLLPLVSLHEILNEGEENGTHVSAGAAGSTDSSGHHTGAAGGHAGGKRRPYGESYASFRTERGGEPTDFWRGRGLTDRAPDDIPNDVPGDIPNDISGGFGPS